MSGTAFGRASEPEVNRIAAVSGHAARDDGLSEAGNTQQAGLEERAELRRERKALRVFKRHPDIGMFADGEPLPRKLVQQAG